MQSHSPEELNFVRIPRTNPCITTILDRAPQLGLSEWYLTVGAVFQTVWNHLDGRDPQSGINDYDVIRKADALFDDLDVRVEVRTKHGCIFGTKTTSACPRHPSPTARTPSITSPPPPAATASGEHPAETTRSTLPTDSPTSST